MILWNFQKKKKIGRYYKIMMAEGRNNAGILEFRNGQPITKGRVIVSSDPNDRSISLNSVPVVTPNCDIVVASLTLRIEPGNTLIFHSNLKPIKLL